MGLLLMVYLGGFGACLVSMLRNVKPTSTRALLLCLVAAVVWPLALAVLLAVAGALFLGGDDDATEDDDLPPGAAGGMA